jgi:prevent-host-death family protein
MSTIPIEQAQADLAKVIHALAPGEEVVITENDKPVAKLVAAEPSSAGRRKFGTLKGIVLYVAPDFDAPLDDFKEYME